MAPKKISPIRIKLNDFKDPRRCIKKEHAHLAYWPTPIISARCFRCVEQCLCCIITSSQIACLPIFITLREARGTELALVMGQLCWHHIRGVSPIERKEFLQKLVRHFSQTRIAKADVSWMHKPLHAHSQSNGSPWIRGSLRTILEAFGVSSAAYTALGTPPPGLGPPLRVATQLGPQCPPTRRYRRSSRRFRH